MTPTLLITGASGLIGTAVTNTCTAAGLHIRQLDLQGTAETYGDIRDPIAVNRVITGCHGIIHLAAVSRVAHAQRDPKRCHDINVNGTQRLLDAALTSPNRPWFILASSREVYGDSADGTDTDALLTEDAPLHPKNVYGHSKLAAERALQDAIKQGIRGATLRLANVYGSAQDHPDRVIPAFVRAALTGQTLQVNGPNRAFDFTHVDDVAATFVSLSLRLLTGANSPETVHLTTGVGITLRHLAERIITATESRSRIWIQTRHAHDVTSFIGCPGRARRVVGWAPKVHLDEGITRLAHDLRYLGYTANLTASQDLLP